MPPLPIRLLSLAMALCSLVACGDHEARQAALAAQQQARAEAEAREGQARVDEVLRSGQIELAYAYAAEIVRRHPGTAAGRALAQRLPELEAAAGEAAEARRLRALWTYHAVDDAEAGGTVRTAYIRGTAIEQENAPAVRLVLRRHPAWGQSIYLLMDHGGDFACAELCEVPLTVDREAPTTVRISRAKDNVPPAVFIEDDARLMPVIEQAHELILALPVKDGRRIAYRFEVGGLDPGRLQAAPE